MALEIVHDVCGHANRNTLRRLGIGGFVEQLERLDETQNDEIDGGDTVPSIDQPMVLAVELGHTAHRAPEALIVATGPGAVDRDRSGSGGFEEAPPARVGGVGRESAAPAYWLKKQN